MCFFMLLYYHNLILRFYYFYYKLLELNLSEWNSPEDDAVFAELNELENDSN